MVVEIVLFVVIVLGVLAVMVWAFLSQARRRRELEELAAGLGLSFEPTDRSGLWQRYRDFDAFRTGRSHGLRNLLHGPYRGTHVCVLEHVFVTGSGKHQQTHRWGVAMAVPGAQTWPRLTIEREHLGHKIADALGADDIDFESDEFSRRFWVRCRDRRFAYDVIHARMMEFLMQPGPTSWQLERDTVCLWRHSPFRASEVTGVLDRLVGFVALVPKHALRPVPFAQVA